MNDDLLDEAIALVDWIPDTIWDSVLIMTLLYSLVWLAVMEVQFWLDRKEMREQ